MQKFSSLKINLEETPFNWKHLAIFMLYSVASFYVILLVTLAIYFLVFYAISGTVDMKHEYRIWRVVVASPFLEIWNRVVKSAPGVPYEFGKYFLCVAIGLLFLNWVRKGRMHSMYHVGKILLVVLLPAFIYAFITVPFNYQYWVFNAFSITQIGILLIFAAKERWYEEQLMDYLKFSVIFIFPILVYITIKTPDFEEMDFKLGAVFATTGGFGSNQVSTILGLAMFIVFMLEIYKKPLFDISMINYGLMGYLFFRGLLTFSRGGVISAVIAMFILYIPIMFKSKRSIINSVIAGVLLGIGGAVVFLIADSVTKNNLTLRYKGETSGTLAGTKEQSLSNITSRRWEIAVTDWEIFKAHPIFGVGPGEARNYREEYGGINIVAHVEYSRLLSEHGIFGGAAMIIITLFAVSWVVRLKSKKGKVISAAFFTLAILSSFHAATRTNTTSVFYVLAAMPIYYDLKRPQVKAIKAAEDAENV